MPDDDLPESKKRLPPEELSRYYLSRQNSSQSYNSDMSKWILGSLILINDSPFLFISKMTENYAKCLSQSAVFFVIGIALAVTCGFLAWLNTGMREALAGRNAVSALTQPLSRGNSFGASEVVINYAINWSWILSILAGFGSLGLFLCGALQLAHSYGKILNAIH